MDLPAIYDPSLTEEKWYAYWMEHGFFRSVPDERPKYSMVIPPPNVTGVLHRAYVKQYHPGCAGQKGPHDG